MISVYILIYYLRLLLFIKSHYFFYDESGLIKINKLKSLSTKSGRFVERIKNKVNVLLFATLKTKL